MPCQVRQLVHLVRPLDKFLFPSFLKSARPIFRRFDVTNGALTNGTRYRHGHVLLTQIFMLLGWIWMSST